MDARAKLHFDRSKMSWRRSWAKKHLFVPAERRPELYYNASTMPSTQYTFRSLTGASRPRAAVAVESRLFSGEHFDPDPELHTAVNVHRLMCSSRTGDMLFLPSYWWHEVYPTRHREGMEHGRQLVVQCYARHASGPAEARGQDATGHINSMELTLNHATLIVMRCRCTDTYKF